MRRTLTIAVLAILAGLALRFGRPWVELARGAASYRVTQSGEAANVVVDGTTAFASLGERGFEIIDTNTEKVLRVIAPPQGSESVDDLAVADGFLFVLDARPPGHLSVFSIADTNLVSPAVEVAVGPFSGVSAGSGTVIVSGGTSQMSMRRYDARGILGPIIATNDFGRGQPDVLLSPDGTRAFVSTHFWGPYFGLTTVRVSPRSMTRAASLDLDTWGFTAGGAKPASFPLRTALDGDVLLLADVDGLRTISVANIAAPKVLAQIDAGVKAVSVDVRDHIAAVVGSSPAPRLVLVDVASPASPRIVRTIPLPANSYPTSVAIGPARIAVASHQQGVLFIPRQQGDKR